MSIRQMCWQVAIRKRRKGLFYDTEFPFTVIPNPPRKWAADPFIIERDNRLFIFAELYPFAGGKGEIGYCVLEGGHITNWTIILDKQYHLSYPYIYEYDNNVFIMPESGQRGTIDIYRAERFPDQWIKECTLVEGKVYVDSTFINQNTLITYNENNRELYYLRINRENEKASLIKKVSDEYSHLRPGGKVLNIKGKRIRPSQIGEKYYGAALAFREIEFINEEYVEREIFKINPGKLTIKGIHRKICGVHTYNCTANFEVIDIQYKKFSLSGFWSRALSKARRLLV